ncbi:MAG: 2-oxo acid dehydrogenase subunit E2 [Armatimonadetes bacterium]|nr:2-oxo acid dehydrogenase subunit E2 [Armatimonadota bacterium]
MSHIPLGKKQSLTTYRKVAIASWRHPRDPSTYSWLDLPVAEAEAFLKAYPADTRPSLTHFIAKIVANCLEEYPDLNHLLRARNLYRRTRTDVFITTLLSTARGKDLSGFVLRDVPGHSLGEVARLSEGALGRLRRGEDAETRSIEAITARMPVWLLRLTMAVEDFAHHTLNVSLRRVGIPDDRFGSVIISNFGALGIDNALVPLSPYCRCPLILGVGRTRPMPVVRDGQVAVAECVTVSFTFDHRYADGVHGGLMLRRFQKIFLHPGRYPAVFEAARPAAAPPAEPAEPAGVVPGAGLP